MRTIAPLLCAFALVGGCSLMTSFDGITGGASPARNDGSEPYPADVNWPDGSRPDGSVPDLDEPDLSTPDAIADSSWETTTGDGPSPCQADLKSDVLNCGKCGHSCLGGKCQNGTCLPHTLVSGLAKPLGITVFQSQVYWADGDLKRLYRMDPNVGTPVRIDSTLDRLGDVFDIAVNASHIYWSERTDNLVCRKLVGSDGGREEVLTGAGQVAYLAIHNDIIYVTDYRTDNPNVGSVVWGRAGITANVLYANQAQAAGIAIANRALTWGLGQKAEIWRGIDDGSGTPTRLISDAGTITGIAVDDQGVYWIADNQRIMQSSEDDTAKITNYKAPASFGIGDIAVDGQAIYWSESENGVIKRLAK